MDHPKRILLGHFNNQLTQQNAKCVGLVIMTDHVHAVVWFPETGQLSKFMQGWKRTSSYAIRQWYEQQQAAYLQSQPLGEVVSNPVESMAASLAS
jgi:putative transposase